MRHRRDYLLDVVTAAQSPGPECEPTVLIERLAEFEDPLLASMQHDAGNRIFEAFDAQAGFLHQWRNGGPDPTPQQLEDWAGLIRWLQKSLWTWSKASDPKLLRLTAMMVVANGSDQETSMWEVLPPTPVSVALLDELSRLVATRTLELRLKMHSMSDDHDEKVLKEIQQADQIEDWPTLDTYRQAFDGAIYSGAVALQIVRLLAVLDFDRLVQATTNVEQFAVAIHAAASLSSRSRLLLASKTSNRRIQFSCVYLSLTHDVSGEPWSLDEQKLLKEVLVKVAADHDAWRKWMTVFNAYPLRYPAMQVPLGWALAEVDDIAQKTYVDAIHLSRLTSYGSRSHVAACLDAFSGATVKANKLALWKYANDRWIQWDYGAKEPQSHSFQIEWCELDYAIVAHAAECMTAAQRASAIASEVKQIESIETAWQRSSSDCATAYNRAMSRIQPLAHADAIDNGTATTFLTNDRYQLRDISDNDYYVMTYRLS